MANKNVAIALCIIMLVIPLVSLNVVRADPLSVWLTQTSGPVGTVVSVYGSGFTPFGQVDIFMNGQVVVSTTASSSGDLTPDVSPAPTFAVPSDLTIGPWSVTVKDGTTQTTTYQTFTVTSDQPVSPAISINPTSGPIGTLVSVTGSGFSPGGQVLIFMNGGVVASTTANANGEITTSFNVPSTVAPGPYTIPAKDGPTQIVVEKTFTVTVFVAPEYLWGSLLPIAACLAAFFIFRKSRSRQP